MYPSLRSILVALLLLTATAAHAQRATVSGYVEDAESGERLIGATVYALQARDGAATNRFGFFTLGLPVGERILEVRSVGFQTDTLRLNLTRDTTLTIRLTAGQELRDVLVEDSRIGRIEESTRTGLVEIPVATLQRLPALGGEVDLFKVLQLLPGVQSGVEGSSGLNVRGGSPDQNLILLDGTPVYNASHLFGFLSVFNSDALNRVELTKSGFPARYGGRLSSVIEIDMKEGNLQQYEFKGSVGVVATSLTVEGPIRKGKASYLISGRRTYIDALIRPFMEDDEKGGYYFYDLNAKVNWLASDRDRLFASVYAGDDRFWAESRDSYQGERNESNADLGWGNVTGALRWNRVISPRLFVNTTLTFARYGFDTQSEVIEEFDGRTTTDFFAYTSGIRDIGGKVNAEFRPDDRHYLRAGIGVIGHRFSPGALSFEIDGEEGIDDLIPDEQITNALALTAYAEDDWDLSASLKVNVGLHGSLFAVEGTQYASIQPRVSARYLVGPTAIKASFATMQQNIHLLTNAGLGLPTDLWVPSTGRVRPQQSWQIAGGVSRTYGAYEVSLEGYYKQMTGLVNYAEGAGFALPGQDWQDLVVSDGEGRSYGAEVFVQRKVGLTTGWVGYTLAWSDRQFDALNEGRRFPYRYDRRHDVSVVLTHQLSPRFDLGAAWVYGTGTAATLAESRFYAPSAAIRQTYQYQINAVRFSDVNGFRMPAYHRLDVSASWFIRKGPKPRILTLSVYNAYNRKNVFYATWDGSGSLKGYALLPIIPSLSYRFSF